MKTHNSRTRCSTRLWISLVLLLISAVLIEFPDTLAQPRKVVPRPVPPVQQPRVTSVTPTKVVLIRGGAAVVVEVKGTNLAMIRSTQIMRSGVPAPGIEAAFAQSERSTILKISLKASRTAKIASDYLLAVLDVGRNRLLEVPSTILVIEVQEPAQNGASSQEPSEPMVTQKHKATAIPTAKTDSAAKLKIKQFERGALIKLKTYKSKYEASQRAKIRTAARKLKGLPIRTCDPFDRPVIERIGGEPIEPGVEFSIEGKGFRPERGILHLELGGGQDFPVFVIEWTDCFVHARLSSDITGVRASADAMLSLKTAEGKEFSQPTRFQPMLEYRVIVNDHEFWAGQRESSYDEDWTVNSFALANDWAYCDHSISWTISPAVNASGQATVWHVDNPPSASIVVRATAWRSHSIHWYLNSIVAGPKGTDYR